MKNPKLLVIVILIISTIVFGCGVGPPPPNEDDHWDGVEDCITALEAMSDAIDGYYNPDLVSGDHPPGQPNPCEEAFYAWADCQYEEPVPLPDQVAGLIYRGELCICATVIYIPPECLDDPLWQAIWSECGEHCPELIRFWETDQDIDARIDDLSITFTAFA
ncbi:MAG TPA: hypothetical protein VGB30_11740 [bacterium]|jgi:hypothetical protein